MYKIRRGCPILGHKDRTHPPNSPSGKPILGLPRTRPYSPRETLLPSGLLWGPGEAGAAPPRRRGRADRTPMAPAAPREQQPHPHASSPSPPPPLPHSRLRTHLNTTDTGREGAALPEVGALEDRALLPWLFHRGRAEHSPNGLVEHCLQAPLGQG